MGWRNTKRKKLEIPYYPKSDSEEFPYELETIEEKSVSKYLGIPLLEVDELDVLEYRFFLREAFIYNCMQTEEGRTYLKNAKRLETTTPERQKLRKTFKK